MATGAEVDAATERRADKSGKKDDSLYVCNLCLKTAINAVIGKCGHLYCWPCLFLYLETCAQKECPNCHSNIADGNVIPIYGRNNNVSPSRFDCEIPPRPAGLRVEPKPQWILNTIILAYDFYLDIEFDRFPIVDHFRISPFSIAHRRDRSLMAFLLVAALCVIWLFFL